MSVPRSGSRPLRGDPPREEDRGGEEGDIPPEHLPPAVSSLPLAQLTAPAGDWAVPSASDDRVNRAPSWRAKHHFAEFA